MTHLSRSVRDVMSAIIGALEESTKVDCEPQEMGLIVCALRYLVPAFVDPSQFDAMVGEETFIASTSYRSSHDDMMNMMMC